MESFDFNKYLPINISELEYDYEELLEMVNYNTSMVVLPHVSNILGNVIDIEYLKDICVKKKCSTYFSTVGSKKYFQDLKTFPKSDIKIKYFQFKDAKYLQCYDNFTPKLSIIDLLFNLGPDSINYIRNNFFICN